MTDRAASRPTRDFLRQCLSNQKVIDIGWANVAGLQVLRIILARVLLNLRRLRMPERRNPHVRELVRNGCTEIENFLSPEVFERLREEAEQAFQDPDLRKGNPPTTDRLGVKTWTLRIDERSFQRYPTTASTFRDNVEFQAIVRGHEGRSRESYIQKGSEKIMFWNSQVDHQPSTDRLDTSNTDLHTDTFHTITKAFLYLSDVDSKNGAHHYVPRSHRLTLKRLWFDYLNSLRTKTGAPRITNDEASRYGDEICSFERPANTLIIANEQGFHARGHFEPAGQRKVLYWEYRTNPFR